MQTLTGTCGHPVEVGYAMSGDSAVYVKDFAPDGTRKISFPVLCPECKARYSKEGLILENEQQRNKWLKRNGRKSKRT